MRPSARGSVVLVVAVSVVTVLALLSAPDSFGQFGQQAGYGQQGDSEKFELRGKVVNSVTGEGVAHALVQVYSAGQKAVFSGDDGGFDFTDVPRGGYQVAARKPGFFNEQELRRWGGYAASVIVPQQAEAVVKLTPEAIIYGRVIDESEEPIEGINVRVQTWRTENGRKQLEDAGEMATDDEGNFRIFELRPGTYLLSFQSVNRGGTVAVQRLSAGEREQGEQGYGRQFYPGVTDVSAATSIRIRAGAHIHLEQVLKREMLFSISGVVRGGDPDGALSLMITDSQGDAVAERTRINYKTGEFQISGVPAGRYLLTASVFPRDANRSNTAAAYIPIQLNRNVSGIVAIVGAGASVGVELNDERTATGMQEGTPKVSLSVQSEGMPQFGRQIMYPPPREDRGAPRQLDGLAPGRYRVEALPTGPGYVADLRCGRVDLLRDDLVVPAGGGLPPIQVTLRNDGAQLSVTAVKGGEAAPAMIVLFSEEYPRRSQGVAFLGNGSIGWGNIAPGSYKLVAVENADELEFRNPSAMEKYLAHAVEVDLGSGDQKNVRVEVQEAQEEKEEQGAQP